LLPIDEAVNHGHSYTEIRRTDYIWRKDPLLTEKQYHREKRSRNRAVKKQGGGKPAGKARKVLGWREEEGPGLH